MAIAQDFIDINNKYNTYNTSFSAASNNTTRVLDNRVNVHVLKDRSLFISDIEPCPIGINISTVVGSNSPKGISTAQIE